MTTSNQDPQNAAPAGPVSDATLVAELVMQNQRLRRQLAARENVEVNLRRHERQLRQVINALPALVAYIDVHHRYRFNNYAYECWYDLPYQQIKGRQITEVVSLPIYRKMLPYLEQALTGESVNYEIELVQRHHQKVWASVTYIPDKQGDRVQGLFSLIYDISDRKATERLKDEFVAVVSHELRTPLASVHGSLKVLATGKLGQLESKGQALLSIALQNTQRLSRLLDDVLDLERIESGHLLLAPAACDAMDLINRAVTSMQPMADEHGIMLAAGAGTASKTLVVWADPDSIIQTLTNLLSNAIKFSPQGATVKVKAQRANPKKGRYVEFRVEDTGRGIPTDKLEIIFERFHQVDTSDAKARGTGLGLAICRDIVQQHQGRIWVKSMHGQGSTFYFTLPAPPQAEGQSEGQSEDK